MIWGKKPTIFGNIHVAGSSELCHGFLLSKSLTLRGLYSEGILKPDRYGRVNSQHLKEAIVEVGSTVPNATWTNPGVEGQQAKLRVLVFTIDHIRQGFICNYTQKFDWRLGVNVSNFQTKSSFPLAHFWRHSCGI